MSHLGLVFRTIGSRARQPLPVNLSRGAMVLAQQTMRGLHVSPTSGQPKIHDLAVSGFAQGTTELYDKARPTYPAEALHTISRAPPRPKEGGLTLLEPGSGTGIFSRILLNPPEGYPKIPIGKLIGVEPSEGMRETWKKTIKSLPSTFLDGRTVDVVPGSFDDFSAVSKFGIEEGQVDGVLIAQAFHWCTDFDAALREIASYLSPGSPLILIWNIEAPSMTWYKAIRKLYEPLDLGSPQYYTSRWREVFDVPAYGELYDKVEESTSQWSKTMTEDQVVDRIFSKSYLTQSHLSGQKRDDFEVELRRLIQQGDKKWIDKEAGTFQYDYNTDIYILRRK